MSHIYSVNFFQASELFTRDPIKFITQIYDETRRLNLRLRKCSDTFHTINVLFLSPGLLYSHTNR